MTFNDYTNAELKQTIRRFELWQELHRDNLKYALSHKQFTSCEYIRSFIVDCEYVIHACKLILWQRELAWRAAMHAHMATLKYQANDSDDVRYAGCQ